MSLKPEQTAAIKKAFDNDAVAQAAFKKALPNEEGLKLLVDTLRLEKYEDTAIQTLAVFYSFDASRNQPSRSGATLPAQPVRGVLVLDGTGGGLNPDKLNAVPAIRGGLCFAEVFPTHLAAVREQWMACAKSAASLNPTTADSEANNFGLFMSLSPFAGGPADPNCKGSDCGKQTIKAK